MNQKIQEPYPPKAKILAWSEFNISDIDRFLLIFKSTNSNEIYPHLEKILDLNSAYLKPKILLDLHYYALKFAIENQFSKIQVSAFLSILRALHNANFETPFDNYQIVLKYFNELIICHSIQRPPFCVEIFDNQTAIKVINYITETYLKHFKLYKYVFTPIVGIKLEIDYGDKMEEDEEDSILDNNSDLKTDSASELRMKTAMSFGTSIVKINESNETVSTVSCNELRTLVKKLMTDYVNSNEVKSEMELLENRRIELFNQKVQEELAKAPKKK